MKIINLIFVGLLLTACAATSYQQRGVGEFGYEDIQLDNNVWEITFKGNEKTDVKRAEEIAMLRAANLSNDAGFEYFMVLKKEVSVKKESHYNKPVIHTDFQRPIFYAGTQPAPVTSASTYVTGGDYTVLKKPTVLLTIRGLNKKPEKSMAYNSEKVINSLSSKYP